MVKKSYEDPVKEEWRNRWYHFIKKNNLLGKSPREVKVAFFPGEEALELEVYDRLRIPRKNLVGLEIDERVHRKLKRKDLGIILTKEPMDALDYFRTTDEKFDIINLDYKGTLNTKTLRTLGQIAGRQLLEERCLLGVTVSGKREQEATKEIYGSSIITKRMVSLMPEKARSLLGGLLSTKDILSIIPPIIEEELAKDNLKDIRDEAISLSISGKLINGRLNLEINPAFKKSPIFPDVIELIKSNKPKGKTSTTEEEAIIFWGNVAESAILFQEFKKGLNNDLEPLMYTTLATLHRGRGYFPNNLERYKYIGQGGTPMFSDFLSLDQHRRSLEKYKYLAENVHGGMDATKLIESVLKRPAKYIEDAKEFLRTIKKDYELLKKMGLIASNPPKRIFLGSSGRLERLTGKKYYEERFADDEKGIPKEETWERLLKTSKVTRTQLPRFEAHYTMETHGQKYLPLITESKEEPITLSAEKPERKIMEKEDIAPLKYFNRLSPERKKRIEYFIEEDLGRLNLNEENARNFAAEIKSSKWYENLNGKEFSDLQFYAFFDDLMLEYSQRGMPSGKRISNLSENVLKENWRQNYPREPAKPLLKNAKQYKLLRLQGKTDDWISRNYRTRKPDSIKAYKAWIRIANDKKTALEKEMAIRQKYHHVRY